MQIAQLNVRRPCAARIPEHELIPLRDGEGAQASQRSPSRHRRLRLRRHILLLIFPISPFASFRLPGGTLLLRCLCLLTLSLSLANINELPLNRCNVMLA